MKNKPSKYMSKLARTNIIKKTKRTYLSMVAVGLSTAIIFTSMTLFLQLYQYSNSTKQKEHGNYHYAVFFEDEGPDLSSSYDYTKDINTYLYGKYHQETFNLRTLKLSESAIVPFELMEGSYPKNENEILVSHLWNVEIGDLIECEMTENDSKTNSNNLYQIDMPNTFNSQKRRYKVVGIYFANETFQSFTNHIDICYTNMEEKGNEVYYIKSSMIAQPDSFDQLTKDIKREGEDIYHNDPIIQVDTVNHYLQNKYSILAIFGFVSFMSLIISIISIHNVILISDKDRQKELGLLKSIGATPQDIKKMLTVELVSLGIMGSLSGLALGVVIAHFILKQITPILGVPFVRGMYFKPLALIVSSIIGLILMMLSGYHSYRPYIDSMPINDLKDQAYQYEAPEDHEKTTKETFQWKMFIIYNARMRKQTKNLKHSFTLLLICTSLFSCIFLANMIYKNHYKDKSYDIDITNVVTDDIFPKPIDLNLLYGLYDYRENSTIDIENMRVQRAVCGIQSQFVIRKNDKNKPFFDYLLKSDLYNSISFKPDTDEITDVGIPFTNTVIDHHQLEELRPYIVSGSIDNMQQGETIVFYVQGDPIGETFKQNYQIGDTFEGEYPLTIKAIVEIPDDEKMNDEVDVYLTYGEFSVLNDYNIFDTYDYNRLFLIPIDENLEVLNINHTSEHIYITLKNPLDALKAENEINEIIGDYKLTNVAFIKQTNAFTTFMIEVLIYPLFFLLFVSALVNIWHVFIGNIYLKRQDISILRTVGMTDKQLYKMLAFEYLEGYLGACFLSSAALISVSLLMELIDFALKFFFKLTISVAIDITANLLGALILSLAILGAILVIPLAILSLSSVKRIKPIEFVKNVG